MRRIVFSVLLTAVPGQFVLAGPGAPFRETFNDAVNMMALGRTAKALPLFLQLYDIDPENANINYLLGICYAEEEIANGKSVFHLERAEDHMVKDYNVHSFNERNVPIYVYYYQTLAYAQHGMCDKAVIARDKFYSYYTFYVEYDYYIKEAQHWVEKCVGERVPYQSGTHTADIRPTIKALKYRKIISREMDYTTDSKLWGVQVGAYQEEFPLGEFSDLSNIEAFMDHDGMIRYVVGHFGFRKQAESLLKAIKQKGYHDAFIVDVNKQKKFSREVIMVDNVSLRQQLNGDVVLKVQLGAFRDSIPNELAGLYLSIDGIETKDQDDLTIFITGSFSSYGMAADYRDEIKNMGVPGCFVVAFNKGKKIPLRQAKSYLRKQNIRKM